VLIALALSVVGDFQPGGPGEQNSDFNRGCTNDPELFGVLPPCSTPAPTTDEQTTSSAPTPLQRINWCRLANGTYLPLGYTFYSTPCSLCRCVQSRSIPCQALQCMPTYCVDNSMPVRRPDQCCTQCHYEQPPNTCSYNNMSFPHGTILKAIEDKMQCWCQLGNIECRNYMGTLFDSVLDGSVAFIIVIVLAIILIFGLLLCCGCTLGFYYYYQRNQQVFQEAYDQYANPAGWQPMEDEEAVVDPAAAEKQLEAEKNAFESRIVDVIPPAYSVYNGSYVPEEEKQ